MMLFRDQAAAPKYLEENKEHPYVGVKFFLNWSRRWMRRQIRPSRSFRTSLKETCNEDRDTETAKVGLYPDSQSKSLCPLSRITSEGVMDWLEEDSLLPALVLQEAGRGRGLC